MSVKPVSQRLKSLDALRGFDMFWITGGHGIIAALAATTNSSFLDWADEQLHHVAWNGFHFYDMIFPLFLFIAGVSMPFSFAKRKERGVPKKDIYRKIFKRGIILVLLGIMYNGFFRMDFEHLRYASVLGRIGLGWMFAALIVENTSIKGQIIWFWGILLGYWAALMLIPVPGHGAGDLSMEGSLVGYVDRMLLPGRLYKGIHDPEGILSTIPAVATALMGVLSGEVLRMKNPKLTPMKKGLILLGSGILFLILGKLWDLGGFPINKNLWTSSFVLFAGGWSLILLAVFYIIIDVWGFSRWSFFFIVIGMNPLTIYLAQPIVDFQQIADYFFKGMIGYASANIQPVLTATSYVVVVWLFLYFLYKQKLFLRV